MNKMLPVFRVIPFFLIFVAASLHAAVITVNSLDDDEENDGSCTLREAITSANSDTASGAASGECTAGAGSDVIKFSIAGTIQPTSQLPEINSVIHIDGYSAPGAVKNTLPLAQGTNAQLKIVIDGVFAGNVPGLRLLGSGASGSLIEGLVIHNSDDPLCCAQNGIYLQDVNGPMTTTIRGNFFGTDVTGSLRRPKASRNVFIQTSANIVVGTGNGGAIDPAAVNLISGSNGEGIIIDQVSNVVFRGNLVGTNAAGTAAVANSSHGVWIDGITSGWIQDNVISASSGSGIFLRGNSSGVIIERNIIGRNAGNTAALPNNRGGIFVTENPNASGASILDVDIVDNVVVDNLCFDGCGGVTIGESNVVNTVKGIRLSRNRIFGNQHMEIDLGETNADNNGLLYGVTPNDPQDADEGANTLQNFPVVTSAIGNAVNVLIDFTFNSEPSKDYVLEFFHTATCDDPSGHGGGELYLGAEPVSTDADGDFEGQVELPLATETGFITATATHEENGTSEFSLCVAVTDDTDFEDGFEDLPPP